MTDLKLPMDLLAFLRGDHSKTLDAGDYGMLQVVPLAQLCEEVLEVTPSSSRYALEDPHRFDGGYYAVPAVNLVEGPPDEPQCFPRLAIVWLPSEQRYASFDQDHGDLMLFRSSLAWAEIAAAAHAYLRAGENCGTNAVPMEYLKPWPKYPYVGPK